MHRRVVHILLGLILAGGLALRLVGIDWGVPREPHFRNYFQDERFVLGLLFQMNPARLDLDPRYYINPSLHYYSVLIALGKADIVGLGLSLPVADDNPFKPSALSARTYTGAFLVGRLLVVLESVFAVFLLFLVGRRLYGTRAGLVSALLTTASYPCVYESHFLVTDAPAVFWMILALYLVVRLRDEPGPRLFHLLAPASIGLAIGTKYTNVLLLLPYLYVLCCVRFGTRSEIPRRISVMPRVTKGLLLAAAAFLATTPYALLSLARFFSGDAQGFGGIFGTRGLLYYNNFPPSLVEPFFVATPAALGIFGALLLLAATLLALVRRRSPDILLLSFILPFYLLLVLKSSTMIRHILPVLPFAFLLMAGVLTARDTIPIPLGNRVMSLAPLVGTALLCLLAAYWAAFSLAAVLRMTRTDTRVQIEQWARANLTSERILLPTYFPFRYTPAIDSFNIAGANYDPRAIDDLQPDYIIMTGPEFTVSGRNDAQAAQKLGFLAAVERHPGYKPALKFTEPFHLGPFRFNPKFPTEDWNFPSPEILIYRRTLTPAGSGG
jgi:hypothetical protein